MIVLQIIGIIILITFATISIFLLIDKNVKSAKTELLDELLKNGDIDSKTYLKYKNK